MVIFSPGNAVHRECTLHLSVPWNGEYTEEGKPRARLKALAAIQGLLGVWGRRAPR